MAYKIRTRDEHFLNDGTPKRILALDGGGLARHSHVVVSRRNRVGAA